ncbi:lysozyme [Acinetobacter sp. NRRL B-65365]|uniref:lysozyme n=1 Tax=Acinetobacter sp. NRRL B-65365 TaxID=1785092 RepID=UPI0007A08A39|nr:lysozyme [Acinetobacter sp. NRRL B-65365]KYQ83468.1 lysozyme [Acinetobacter sp. NRRL B-65365]
MKTFFDFLHRIIGSKTFSYKDRSANKDSNIATAVDVDDAIGVAVDSNDYERSISKAGINLITSFEDLKLDAYDDGTGTWTIGFGTTVYPDGIRVQQGDHCTAEQAKSFFQHDLRRFQKAVNKAVLVTLSQNQFDALVSLSYNIGQNAFKNSTLLKYLNAGDYRAAADQFLVWNKGGGQILKGLVHRREVERTLFLKR